MKTQTTAAATLTTLLTCFSVRSLAADPCQTIEFSGVVGEWHWSGTLNQPSVLAPLTENGPYIIVYNDRNTEVRAPEKSKSYRLYVDGSKISEGNLAPGGFGVPTPSSLSRTYQATPTKNWCVAAGKLAVLEITKENTETSRVQIALSGFAPAFEKASEAAAAAAHCPVSGGT